MSELQLTVAHVVRLLLLVLLAGMLWRGRVRQCWAFAAYVLAALLGNTLVSLWPERFFNPPFWVLKQGVYDVLKIAIALELAWRSFHAFPGAQRTAQRVLLALLVVSTLCPRVRSPPRPSFETLWEWQPPVATAALWLLTATALMVVWYQVPVNGWQRAIMLGLAPYLLVFVSLLGLLERRGWAVVGELFATAETLAYLALVAFWSWAAWRRDRRRPRPRSRGAARDARARPLLGRLRAAVLHASGATTAPSRCSAGSSC